MTDDRRVLVTGGGGFLGRTIIDQLVEEAEWDIRALDLGFKAPMPAGVTTFEGNLLDLEMLATATQGADAIVHCASLVDWGQATAKHLEAVNVGGVAAVIEAATANGVRAIVHTSTMDVVCGFDPVVDADETRPFPSVFTNEYSRTKAAGERLALAANSPDLRVCALRPCGMFGEADPYHIANVVRLAKSRKLPMRLGDGSARHQHVYVGNVAHAHVVTLHDLLSEDSRAAGEAYFVTDDEEPADFLDHLEPILSALGHTLPTRHLPEPIAMAIGGLMEGVSSVTRRIPFLPTFTPTLTRSSVRFVCHDYTFDGGKLRRDLGYVPRWSADEAMDRTVAWWKQHEGVT